MKQFQAPTAQDMVRFLSKIRFAGQDECWMWMGTLSRKGYPEFSLGGRPRRATQIAMEWLGGIDMGDGGHALHRCDRPPCVNPTHLFRGDNVANNADRDAKGRTRKGERHAGSVVSDDAITLMFERKSAGWKLRAIAEEAGCCISSASQILNGRIRRSHPLARAAFERTPPALFTRYTVEEKAEVARRARAGERPEAIAEALGRAVRGVYAVIRDSTHRDLGS
jgi:hypothetical protein